MILKGENLKRIIFLLVVIVCLSSITVLAEDKLIDLQVRNAEINDVLVMLTEQSGANLVPDSSVEGKVTLNIEQVSLAEVFEIMTLAHGYHFEEVSENTYFVSEQEFNYAPEVEITDELLTIKAEDKDVREILNLISQQAGVNILIDNSVQGTISANLTEVPFQQGLIILLQANGFSVSENNGLYQVTKIDNRTRGRQLEISIINEQLTIDVEQADLAEVLRTISRKSGIDMVMFDNVRGSIDLKLKEKPVDDVIQIALAGSNFTYRKKDGIYLIGDKNVNSPTASLFTVNEVIEINHLRAEEVPSLLPPDFPGSNIKVLDKQNAILATGIQPDINNLKSYIEQIDKKVPQIVVEALIIEVSESESDKPDSKVTMSYDNDNTLLDTALGRFTYKSILELPKNFNLRIQSLVEKGKATVKARPNITTLNNKQAEIDIGTVQYYREAADDDDDRTRYRSIDAGVNLSVTPWVNSEGDITLDVAPQVSNISGAVSDGPPNVSRRRANATVRVKDGESIVLGGLIQDVTSESESRVPFLGRVPILGRLFRSKSSDINQTELIIYLTPYILDEERKQEKEDESEESIEELLEEIEEIENE